MKDDIKFDLSAIDKTFATYKEGEIINATVVTTTKDGYVVNIGGKKDGFIKFNENEDAAFENFDMAKSFEAIVVNTKNEEGVIYVSKARADALREGNKIVGALQVGDPIKFIVTEAVNNGLISNIGCFRLFVPYSQISNRRVDNNLKNYVNKQMVGTLLEIDKDNLKLVASVKEYEQKRQLSIEQAFWGAIFVDKVVKGKVVRFTDFGAFVNVNGIDCLVHNNEVSYNKQQVAQDVLAIDNEYEFKVIKVDKEAKRVALSYKALQQNPLLPKLKALKIDDVYECEVIKILPNFALLKFGDDLEGRLGVKDISYDNSKKISDVAHVGDKMELKLINVDLEKLRVDFSLIAMMPTEYSFEYKK